MSNSGAPSKCCPVCFGDPGLHGIIKALSDSRGECPVCLSPSEPLATVEQVREPFRMVADAYSPGRGDSTLMECLKKDWNLFGNNAIREDKQAELLGEILGRKRLSQKYKPFQGDFGEDRSGEFAEFREEIICKNRWFFDTAGFVQDSKEFLSDLVYELRPSERLYRARVTPGSEERFVASEMGAPPPDIARGGRSNPDGISYLYLASDCETALSEVRARVGQVVAVGTFEFNTLRVVDFAEMRQTYSPFTLDETAKVGIHASKLEFFEAVSKEMSKPVLGRFELEYLPTQYICEMLKSFGFKGVRYRSSQGEGHNFVLFDRDSAVANEVHHFEISTMKIQKVVLSSQAGQGQ